MLGLIVTFAFAMFAQDNAEFIKDVEQKRSEGYRFEYAGKHDADPAIPHIDMGCKVYFSMRKE